jgi:hypothetical protein
MLQILEGLLRIGGRVILGWSLPQRVRQSGNTRQCMKIMLTTKIVSNVNIYKKQKDVHHKRLKHDRHLGRLFEAVGQTNGMIPFR